MREIATENAPFRSQFGGRTDDIRDSSGLISLSGLIREPLPAQDFPSSPDEFGTGRAIHSGIG
jgi:hypothetical protein